MAYRRALIVLVVVGAMLPLGLASAQYPEPLGVCTVVPDSGSVQPNSVATFTVSTRTAAGAPAPGVSGTVSIAAGAGTVLTPTFTTGANGTTSIRVQTGNAPGDLALAVTCGALQTSGVVRVATPSVLPKPPDTGNAGLTPTVSHAATWLMPATLASLVVLLSGAGFALGTSPAQVAELGP